MKRKPTDEDYVEWLEDEQNKKIIRILGVSYLLDSLDYFIEKSAFRLHLILVSLCLCLDIQAILVLVLGLVLFLHTLVLVQALILHLVVSLYPLLNKIPLLVTGSLVKTNCLQH